MLLCNFLLNIMKDQKYGTPLELTSDCKMLNHILLIIKKEMVKRMCKIAFSYAFYRSYTFSEDLLSKKIINSTVTWMNRAKHVLDTLPQIMK